MTAMARPIRITVPLAIVAVLIAALATWAWGSGGGGLTEHGQISGIIEITVRDAAGAVKLNKVIHNATLDTLLDAGRDRLGVDGTLAGLTDDSGLFDNIQLVGANLSGGDATGNLTLNLDANPKDGTNTALGESGNYETFATFTASGPATIEELQLTSGSAVNGTVEAAGAWQDVSITLADTDTLTITWTVDID